MIRLQVSEFGPIVKGAIDLKPLTIFVGPNNSGKSYFAVLAYALFRSLPPIYPFPHGLAWRVRRYRLYGEHYLPGLEETSAAELLDKGEALKSLQEWLRARADESRRGKITVLFKDLPDKLKQSLEKILLDYTNAASMTFGEELKRCYGTVIPELTRKNAKRPFEIAISQENPPLYIKMSHTNDNIKLIDSTFDVSDESFSVQIPPPILTRRPVTEREQFLLYELVERFFERIYREFLVDPYYFPAARSGILQSHKALASYVVSRSPLAGIEKLPEVPRLQGVVADFISKLLYLEKDRPTKLYDLAAFLESQVTKGVIDIEAGKLEYPEIYYEPDSGKFPLHRTSSMVSELAPMVLFLKYLIDPGDFVIIEEPESHLHPESQRKLATGIVKLIRARVKVLITTHSGDFVDQLSNFIRLGQLPEERRVKEGYSSEDFLSSGEVGAFLFKFNPTAGGTLIEELKVSPEEGIPEEEFAKVKEALYRETVFLHRAVSR